MGLIEIVRAEISNRWCESDDSMLLEKVREIKLLRWHRTRDLSNVVEVHHRDYNSNSWNLSINLLCTFFAKYCLTRQEITNILTASPCRKSIWKSWAGVLARIHWLKQCSATVNSGILNMGKFYWAHFLDYNKIVKEYNSINKCAWFKKLKTVIIKENGQIPHSFHVCV